MRKLPLLFLVLILAAPVWGASQAKDLYQRALIKESVERDLDGAIVFYQRAIDEAPDEPAIAGESRLRMAICFEKLGKSVYAEGLYRQILDHPAHISSDVVQQARTNLRRIEAEKHIVEPRVIVIGSSGTVPGTWVHQFFPLRATFIVGPAFLVSDNGAPINSLVLGLRIRMSAIDRPTAWYLDTRGIIPLGQTNVAHQSATFGSQMDTASLSLRYQASLGLVGELPHGRQRRAIPEVGAGLVFTSAKTSYMSASSAGDTTHTTTSPYIETGVHLFPDQLVSVLLQARYISTPYSKSIDIPSPAHTQTFNFPASQWSLGAALQIKIGYRKWILKTPS